MRVLHVHSGNLYGGIETMMVTLARFRHLCSEMEMHTALCFDGRLSDELESAGVPVYRLGNVRVSHPLSVWRARRQLKKLLDRNRFDAAICHSSWSQSIFGPIIRTAKRPLIFWLHGEVKGDHWLERWARLTRPDLAICNSRFSCGTIGKLYRGIDAAVIYCPVASPAWGLTPSDRCGVRAELETPQDAIVIIQVSRMEACKGHALHLQALSLLKDLPNWYCWQVGGAQRPQEQLYLDGLRSMVEDLGIAERVRFLGQRSDVPRLLAAADIHCQPNVTPDAFGITFIEAMYARLPVVTTDFGHGNEIVNDECGILVPDENIQALSNSLRRLIGDPMLRQHLGATGPGRAKRLTDPSTQLPRLCQVLTKSVHSIG